VFFVLLLHLGVVGKNNMTPFLINLPNTAQFSTQLIPSTQLATAVHTFTSVVERDADSGEDGRSPEVSPRSQDPEKAEYVNKAPNQSEFRQQLSIDVNSTNPIRFLLFFFVFVRRDNYSSGMRGPVILIPPIPNRTRRSQ
jgi:hypothetical protein